jgi:tetratricopeptide (TPR) repeat protein
MDKSEVAMKLPAIVASILFSLLFSLTVSGQVKAGSSESELFDKITSEPSPDNKLALIASFEKQYGSSRILPRVYLLAVDVYRQKGDRAKITEYGEKVLQADDTNVTAMMLLARNYAIEAKNLARALELAQRAHDQTAKLREGPLPFGYSAAQWNDYLKTNEDSATQILEYVKAVKARQDRIDSPPSTASTAGDKSKTPPVIDTNPASDRTP